MRLRGRSRWAVLLLASGVGVGWGAACASGGSRYRAPATLRGYEIVVPRRDTLSDAMAAALGRVKLRVRRDVRGGNRPAAVLIHQLFREPGPGGRVLLQGRIYDSRSGAIVGAATVPLDSLGLSGRERAAGLVRALVAPADSIRTQD